MINLHRETTSIMVCLNIAERRISLLGLEQFYKKLHSLGLISLEFDQKYPTKTATSKLFSYAQNLEFKTAKNFLNKKKKESKSSRGGLVRKSVSWVWYIDRYHIDCSEVETLCRNSNCRALGAAMPL